MDGNRERIYAYWLDQIKGIGRITIHRMLEQYESAEKIYFIHESHLSNILTQKQQEQFKRSKKQWNLYTEYEKLIEQKIKFYHVGDPDYPERLRRIPDTPYALYVKGELPDLGAGAIAVIGARTCSEYGRMMAERFAATFAESGIQVISGMARGIDGISQKSVIAQGGKTFAVLGCGCNVCYPPENRKLYDQICECGGVISEYPPDTQPIPSLFPPRNRIISGLADAVLVIEAKEKSGTLITVDMALEQGRDIFAIPGRITDPLSSGCNRLIRQGAGVAISPDQVLEEVYGESYCEHVIARSGKYKECDKEVDNGRAELIEKSLSETEKIILQKTDYVPISFEVLLESCRRILPELSLQQLTTHLLTLQIKGLVGREGSHYYKTGSR